MTDDFSNTKLLIEAFEKVDFGGSPAFTYEVMVNPEGYKLATKVEYDDKQGKGNWSTNQKFKIVKPSELTLKFTLDGTGLTGFTPDTGGGTASSGTGDVQKSIDYMMKVVRDPSGSTHRPHFCRICWADLVFKGVFLTGDFDYTYFHRSGRPLRAVVTLSFNGTIDDEARVAKEKKSSPDVTHIHTVRKGETLPYLSHKVYGNPKYYLEVAKINELGNYRKLEPGQQLIFPPLAKN